MKSHERARLLGIGYVPQGREIIPDITVEYNLEWALIGLGERNQMPPTCWTTSRRCKPGGRKGGVLDGGQQQQLAIAGRSPRSRSCCCSMSPTEGLQPSVVEEIQRFDQGEASDLEQKCAILLVEQKSALRRDITRKFAILDTAGSCARRYPRAHRRGGRGRHVSV